MDEEEPQRWETRHELLKVSARLGKCSTEMVLDSGSQVNIITHDYAKLTGLPIQMPSSNQIKLAGVGGIVEYGGIIPETQIYVTDAQVPTLGKFYVIEKGTIPLLGGRPWATRNRAGILEKRDGSHLNFWSDAGENFVLNVLYQPVMSFGHVTVGIFV
jgi:hypothetical protein